MLTANPPEPGHPADPADAWKPPGDFSNSALLHWKIRLAYPRLGVLAHHFWSRPDLAVLYPEFLFHLHTFIRSSVPMMLEGAELARDLGDDDPVGPILAEYLEHHAEEERGHDEWLVEDLEVLGVSRQEVMERLPSTAAAALVGSFYYWMRHVHPVALLSYLAVLEGNPPVVEELEKSRAIAGLPEESFRTLLRHARLDPHHRDDLNDLIDRLPLTARHHELLALSSFHTIEKVSLVLEQILDAQDG